MPDRKEALPRLATLLLALLVAACTFRPTTPEIDWDDYPLRQTTEPVLTLSEFADVFAELCLRPIRPVREIDRDARRYEMRRTATRWDAWSNRFEWERSSGTDPKPIALTISTGDFHASVIGGPDISRRSRTCTLSAALPPLSDQDAARLKQMAEGPLTRRARALDFSRANDGNAVPAENIQVAFVAPRRVTRRASGAGPDDTREGYSVMTAGALSLHIELGL